MAAYVKISNSIKDGEIKSEDNDSVKTPETVVAVDTSVETAEAALNKNDETHGEPIKFRSTLGKHEMLAFIGTATIHNETNE